MLFVCCTKVCKRPPEMKKQPLTNSEQRIQRREQTGNKCEHYNINPLKIICSVCNKNSIK
jgi:hypothetical protein